MHNTQIILSLKSIHKEYLTGISEKQTVLNFINLELKKGELIAIIGPSGAGKSTLLQIIGLLLNPTSGEIILNNENCSAMNEKKRTLLRRKHLGFIYQFHHLLPEFSVIENLMIPQMINGESKKQSKNKGLEILEELGMQKHIYNDVSKLSGGEQQRVAIARSIINNPSVILADEPTGNLDQHNADLAMSLIKRQIKEKNKSAILVTHNLDLLSQVDRKFRLNNGRLDLF